MTRSLLTTALLLSAFVILGPLAAFGQETTDEKLRRLEGEVRILELTLQNHLASKKALREENARLTNQVEELRKEVGRLSGLCKEHGVATEESRKGATSSSEITGKYTAGGHDIDLGEDKELSSSEDKDHNQLAPDKPLNEEPEETLTAEQRRRKYWRLKFSPLRRDDEAAEAGEEEAEPATNDATQQPAVQKPKRADEATEARGHEVAQGAHLNQPLNEEQKAILGKCRKQLQQQMDKCDDLAHRRPPRVSALNRAIRGSELHPEVETMRGSRWGIEDSAMRGLQPSPGVMGLRFKLAKQLAIYGQVAECLDELKKLETMPVARMKERRVMALKLDGKFHPRIIRKLVIENKPYAEFADNCSECAVALIENSRGPGVTDAVTQICKLCGSEAMSALNIRCLAEGCATAANDAQDNTRKLEQLKFAVKLYDMILAKDPNAGYARDRIHALRKQIEDLADRGDNPPRIDPFSAP